MKYFFKFSLQLFHLYLINHFQTFHNAINLQICHIQNHEVIFYHLIIYQIQHIINLHQLLIKRMDIQPLIDYLDSKVIIKK